MDSTCFCIKCRKKVPYILKTRTIELRIHGDILECDEVFATCKKCGIELYIPEINDINVKLRNDAYQEHFINRHVDAFRISKDF